jgi:uncharacterized protein YndB with AHSA1/START domain
MSEMTAQKASGSDARMIGENELVIERVFDAPRELVWKAWTDPDLLMQWWGPKANTSPVCKLDFRIGGKYLFCDRSPEGQDYWSTGVYHEILPYERIVCTLGFADPQGNRVPASYYGLEQDMPMELEVTAIFETLGDGKTRLTLRHAGIPGGELKAQYSAGWLEAFDKMAGALDKVRGKITRGKTTLLAEPGKSVIQVTRIFDAPRELVFKVTTDPRLIPQWWGPRIYTTTVEKMEVRPGGMWRFVQKGDDGSPYAFHGVYHDVVPGERVVSTFEFEGFPGHVLLEMVDYEDLGGKTRLRGTYVYASVEDRDGMLSSGMADGESESYDRLDELLAKRK